VLGRFKVTAAPNDVAIERATTGDFFVAASNEREKPIEVFSSHGVFLEKWGPFEEGHIALDDSSEPLIDPSACGTWPLLPSECVLYVSVHGTDPMVHSVEKLDSRGRPIAFAGVRNCDAAHCGYIQGSRLTGRPGSGCGSVFTLTDYNAAVAVDAQGDLFVAMPSCKSVFEYRPSGEYVQAFDLQSQEVARVGKGEQVGTIEGVVIGAVSGRLLVQVSVEEATGYEGAIDEFDTQTGRFVSQIAGTPETIDR
jgi:hypothetical protein